MVWTFVLVMSVTQGSDMSNGRSGCGLGQSVVKLEAQLLVLMNKTASFKPVFGETVQPGFHGMVCQELESFCLHHVLGVPPLTKTLDSSEPLHFCDRRGPHRTSDQAKCLVLDLVKGLLLGLYCGLPRCGAIFEMGSDCFLVHCF